MIWLEHISYLKFNFVVFVMPVSNYLEVMKELFGYKPAVGLSGLEKVDRIAVTISPSGRLSTEGKRIEFDLTTYKPQDVYDLFSKLIDTNPCKKETQRYVGFAKKHYPADFDCFYIWLIPNRGECVGQLSGMLRDFQEVQKSS